MNKVGLVLEGGGLRGIFTAGVIDCLLDKNVEMDYVVGVSAGSCNAFEYIGKQRGYIKSCLIQKNKFESFYGVPQMIESHKYVDLDKVFDEYSKKYGFDYDAFINNPIEWEMVVSNINTGKAEYMHSDNKDEAVLIGKASCSLPGLTSPRQIGDYLYLDGGICDSIPVQRALDMGCDKVVVVLTRKKGNFSVTNEATKILFRRLYAEYPEFVQALMDRNDLYVSQVKLAEELERQGKAIIIRPTMQEVGRLESDEKALMLSYYHGYTKAKEYTDKIKGFKI